MGSENSDSVFAGEITKASQPDVAYFGKIGSRKLTLSSDRIMALEKYMLIMAS